MCKVLPDLSEEAEQDTCSNRTSDNAGHVRTHRVHQKEVGRIVLLALYMGNSCRVRNRRYTGVADERIELLAFLLEQVQYLAEENTGKSCYYKGSCTKCENQN